MANRIPTWWLLPLCLCGAASAHRPTISDGRAVDLEHAIFVADPDLSQVVYHEVTADAAQLWLAFDATAGKSLHVQLGVPVLDRLKGYAPSVALVGPGLPEAELPFEIPEGWGGIVWAGGPAEEGVRVDGVE